MHKSHSTTSRTGAAIWVLVLASVASPMVALGMDVALFLWSKGG